MRELFPKHLKNLITAILGQIPQANSEVLPWAKKGKFHSSFFGSVYVSGISRE